MTEIPLDECEVAGFVKERRRETQISGAESAF